LHLYKVFKVENLVEAHLKSVAQTTMRSLLREQFYYLTSSELKGTMLATLEDDISFQRTEYNVLQADCNDLRKRYHDFNEEMRVDPSYISCRVKKELDEQIQPLNDAMKRLNSQEHRLSKAVESIVDYGAAEVGNLMDIAIHDVRKEVENVLIRLKMAS
jgi:chaperonin cofactor prefoldin